MYNFQFCQKSQTTLIICMKMTFSRRSIVTLCFLLVPLIMTAQESTEESSTNSINHIFDALPVEGTLEEAPQELYSQFSQNPFGIPSSRNNQVMDLFLDAFETDSLLAYAREAFHQNFNASDPDFSLRRFNSNAVQKVLEAEKEFYTLQGIRKRIVNRYEMEQNPPAEKRQTVIDSLTQAKSAAELEVESQVIIFRALISAFSELDSQQMFDKTQVEGFVNNFRYQIQSQIDSNVRRQLMLMYHGIENDTLKEYINFYETESGNRLGKIMNESIHSAYRKAADQFVESVRNS